MKTIIICFFLLASTTLWSTNVEDLIAFKISDSTFVVANTNSGGNYRVIRFGDSVCFVRIEGTSYAPIFAVSHTNYHLNQNYELIDTVKFLAMRNSSIVHIPKF